MYIRDFTSVWSKIKTSLQTPVFNVCFKFVMTHCMERNPELLPTW